MKSPSGVALAGWLLCASAATAAAPASQDLTSVDGATRGDLRCISAVAQSAKRLGTADSNVFLTQIYFLGRISARHGELDLKQALAQRDLGPDTKAVDEEASRCDLEATKAVSALALSRQQTGAAPAPGLAGLDADTLGDLRCIRAIAQAKQPPPPGMRPNDMAALVEFIADIYFLGRISARHPELDLMQALAPKPLGLSRSALEAEAARCGAMMTPSLQAMDEASKNADGAPPPEVH
jgi:hypothetical protein